MDEYGKIVFLTGLIRRKDKLFDNSNKLSWEERQKIWNEIFDECAAAGCTGLVTADHLRKTTWQNLQRRARYRYEKSLTDRTVKFTKVDLLVLDIIGRENVRESFLNETALVKPEQFNHEIEEIPNGFDFPRRILDNPTPTSSNNEYQSSLADGIHSPLPLTAEHINNSLNTVFSNNKLELSQNCVQVNEEDEEGSQIHCSYLNNQQQEILINSQQHSLDKANKIYLPRKRTIYNHEGRSVYDPEILQLKKQRLMAKIEKIKAQTAKISAEARLIQAEAEIKESEIRKTQNL